MVSGIQLNQEEKERSTDIQDKAHCINAIREYIMCRPDVNIVYTYEWAEEPEHFNMTAVTDTSTTCVKWDSIDRWLRPRDLHPPYPFVEPDWLKKAKGGL